MKLKISYLRIFLIFSILFISVTLLFKSFSCNHQTSMKQNEKIEPKNQNIIADQHATFIDNTNKILYDVVEKYRVISIMDVSCSLLMSSILKNLSTEFNKKFSYHAICANSTLVKRIEKSFSTIGIEIKASQLDITKEKLPINYELIVANGVLEYQSLNEIINSLKNFASTKNSLYFLVDCFIKSKSNSTTISKGKHSQLDLTQRPFTLTNYVQKYENDIQKQKYMLLYELNSIKKVNFTKMKEDAEKTETVL